MHLIKKYANRKLYDTTDRKYVKMDDIADLIKSGEEVRIIDNQTDADLTAKIVSQLLSREKPGGETAGEEGAVPASVLTQMLRKGQNAVFGYGKKYASLWHSAFLMSRDELDRLVNSLVRESEISESEGKNLKSEISGYAAGLRRWMKESIDQGVHEAMARMNLASIDQVKELEKKVDGLVARIDVLEDEVQKEKLG